MTSTKTQTTGNTPTDGNGGTVAFTTEAVEKARGIITGYEAKDLVIYISSCRSLALVVNKIDKGQRTDFKAEVAAGGEDENGEERPAVSVSTIDAMLKVGQWVLTLTGLGVPVSAIQVLPVVKRQIQNGLRQTKTNKIKREDVPEVLTLDWLYEVGALVPLAPSKPAGSREARPEGNDMDAPPEGTSAPMGGNVEQETIKEALDGIRSRQPKVMHHDGVYETLTMEELETMLQNNGLINAKIKKAQAKLKAAPV